jgi:hypothetical protein
LTAVEWGRIETDLGGGQRRAITDPVVTAENSVIDAGAMLANFNDDFTGKAPDLGVFEVGRSPLEFGRRSFLKWSEGRAP